MTFSKILRAIAACCALATLSLPASANPSSVGGQWSVIGNNSPGTLIMSQAPNGVITGSIYGNSIQGLYIPSTRRLVFARLAGNTPVQLFEAHVSGNGQYLAGSLIAWNGSGGASQSGVDFNFQAEREFDDPPSQTRRLTVDKLAGVGRVVSTPAGIDCGDGSAGRCVADFPRGINVSLKASPGAGQITSFWGGDCPNFVNPNASSVTMSTDRLCTVFFENSDL